MLTKFISTKKSQWEDYLDTCVYAYNTSVHESSRFTPYELMFGRKAVLPIDLEVAKQDASDVLLDYLDQTQAGMLLSFLLYLYYNSFIIEIEHDVEHDVDVDSRQEVLDRAKANIIKAQQKQKETYDRKHSCPEVYQIGSVVLKKDFTRKKRKGGKLDTKWLGPFRILGSLGRGLYRLKDIQTGQVVPHVNGVHMKPYNV